jgi:DNA modification methylase
MTVSDVLEKKGLLLGHASNFWVSDLKITLLRAQEDLFLQPSGATELASAILAANQLPNDEMNNDTETLKFLPDGLIPAEVGLIKNHQTDLPRIAKDRAATMAIQKILSTLPTQHFLRKEDARNLEMVPDESIHLVVTSPPYWTLKDYRDSEGQMGHIEEYGAFLSELDRVWKHCYRTLVPGGRLVCVVGDVCLSRRKNKGEHTVIPLHASIQEHCRALGFMNLAPIIWYKIANASYEASGNGGGFLGKPYEPNAVIKNDIEFVLMLRKPGGYRSPNLATRVLSVIPEAEHRQWFQQIWTGITGASTKQHPAPFPVEIAERLIRMFSFVGDTVLDPFMGTGTTTVAAAKTGRNSIGVEVDPHYFDLAVGRIDKDLRKFSCNATIEA